MPTRLTSGQGDNRAVEVSVVIPNRRAVSLRDTLACLVEQDLPSKAFEVIVVRDPLSEREESVPEGLPVRFIYLDEPCGPARKRNVGWRTAVAPLVAFTDDDCEPTGVWLRALRDAHARDADAVLQGVTEPNPAHASRAGPYSRTLTVRELGPWYPTCNIAYPRSVLERLGGFDEAFSGVGGEDTDLAWRALSEGVPVSLVSEALVRHAVAWLGPRATLRVAARWGDAMVVFKRHPELRRVLIAGAFWKRSHLRLVLALIGLAATPRWKRASLFLIPYVRELRGRAAGDGAGPEAFGFYALHDLVELLGTVRGAAKARVLVL